MPRIWRLGSDEFNEISSVHYKTNWSISGLLNALSTKNVGKTSISICLMMVCRFFAVGTTMWNKINGSGDTLKNVQLSSTPGKSGKEIGLLLKPAGTCWVRGGGRSSYEVWDG